MRTFNSVLLALGLCAFGVAHAATQNIILKNAKGETVGTATITALTKGVKIDADLHGLAPGEHAIHFHDKGSCVGPKFDSAGGHFSPTKMEHGFDSPAGPHAGDMANFFAAKDGTAKLEIVNTSVMLTPESLLKAGGTALVVHEKADDYKTQPSGDAGGRFACGEIK
jgi:Cu-Zn family superoxide dismutase